MHTRRKLITIALAAALAGTLACSDDETGPSVQAFTATFTQLNGSGVSGNATFTIDGDSLVARVNGLGLAASILHAQHVHTAALCPDSSADVNADGFVDVLEGVPSYGTILVPLDGDISTQEGGSADFPFADVSGGVVYSQSATLAGMLLDLHAADADTTDGISKLAADDDLDLGGRTVVLHGIPDTDVLPATVDSLGTLSPHATLPVACGEIS